MNKMDNIEFRAWLKHYKMVVKVERINFDVRTIEGQIGEGDLYEFSFKEVELMQYIGLKDANDEKIYKSDIISTYDFAHERTGGRARDKEIIGEVDFKYGEWILIEISTGKEYNFFTLYINDMELEIIGNTYNNPELLGEL
jgi:uncharacterized phage protein (TIGR01671 family)